MTDLQYLFRNNTIATSTTTNSTNLINCTNAYKVSLEVKNTGTSTDCTVYINGSITPDITFYTTLASFKLGAGDTGGTSITSDIIPEYLWARVVNNDASNTAIVTVRILVKSVNVDESTQTGIANDILTTNIDDLKYYSGGSLGKALYYLDRFRKLWVKGE